MEYSGFYFQFCIIKGGISVFILNGVLASFLYANLYTKIFINKFMISG